MWNFRLQLLALLAAAPLTSGCMYFELTGGYYFPSGEKPSKLPAGTTVPDPQLNASWGVGIAGGAYYDIGDTGVRVAAGARADANFVDNGGSEQSTTTSGPELRADYLFDQADGLLAAVAVSPGTATLKYGGYGDDVGATSLNLYVAPGIRSGDDSGHFILTGGLRYTSAENRDQTQGNVGAMSMWGPELRFTIGFDLTADGGGSSGGGGGGGGGDVVGWSITFDDATNVIPALAQGARRRGCTVDEKSDGAICRCSEGNVVFIQRGREMAVLCQQGMSESTCRGVVHDIVEAAK